MSPEISLLIEVWDKIKSHIPKKDKLFIAEDIVRLFDEHVELIDAEHELNELDGSLKAAIISHYDIGLDEEDEEDEEY
jgi:hypothetical protein